MQDIEWSVLAFLDKGYTCTVYRLRLGCVQGWVCAMDNLGGGLMKMKQSYRYPFSFLKIVKIKPILDTHTQKVIAHPLFSQNVGF